MRAGVGDLNGGPPGGPRRRHLGRLRGEHRMWLEGGTRAAFAGVRAPLRGGYRCPCRGPVVPRAAAALAVLRRAASPEGDFGLRRGAARGGTGAVSAVGAQVIRGGGASQDEGPRGRPGHGPTGGGGAGRGG